MKIGLIIPANLKFSPYVQYYFRVLDKNKVEYRTIVWDKADIEENSDYSMRYHCKDTNRKKILVGHLLFANKCKRIIKKEKIDHLIVFTIAPLFFLGEKYLKKFKGKMIVDIRDDSPFRIHFESKLKSICELAQTVVVSSMNYAPWTGRDVVLCHNADTELINKYFNISVNCNKDLPVRIVFAGSMIEPDMNIHMISLLRNNEKFSLGFIGKPNVAKEKIVDYVKDNDIDNVWFEGTYKKEDIVNIYRKKATLINIFRAKTTVNKNALPNKLYDAVVAGIPLIVMDHNEAISHYVTNYHLGIILQESELADLENVIINKLNSFDFKQFSMGRTEFLKMVLADQKHFEFQVQNFINAKS